MGMGRYMGYIGIYKVAYDILRPWSRFYKEYEDNVNSLMQMVW